MPFMFLVFVLLIGEGLCAPIPVENNSHIQSLISPVKLTRLAVEKDRILEAFLSDENVLIEKDERNGQLFLHPKEGALEISLTLVTENGLTVDLTLQVSEQADSALILKPKNTGAIKAKRGQAPKASSFDKATSPLSRAEPFQKKILGLMRALYDEKDSLEGGEDRTYPGFYTVAVGSLSSGDFEATLYKLDTPKDRIPSLNERDFLRPGDMAVALLKRTLGPKESTDLMIVRSIHGHP